VNLENQDGCGLKGSLQGATGRSELRRSQNVSRGKQEYKGQVRGMGASGVHWCAWSRFAAYVRVRAATEGTIFVSGLVTLAVTLTPSRGDQAEHSRVHEPPNMKTASNDPWPTLPDGRLAFDVYARRVAIPPRASACRTWTSTSTQPPPGKVEFCR
jgi:hypothetical protein